MGVVIFPGRSEQKLGFSLKPPQPPGLYHARAMSTIGASKVSTITCTHGSVLPEPLRSL